MIAATALPNPTGPAESITFPLQAAMIAATLLPLPPGEAGAELLNAAARFFQAAANLAMVNA